MSQNDDAIKLYKEGKVKEALCMAKRFTMSFEPEEILTIKRGYECLLRPEFYRQIGKDPEKAVEEAKKTFELFMEWFIDGKEGRR